MLEERTCPGSTRVLSEVGPAGPIERATVGVRVSEVRSDIGNRQRMRADMQDSVVADGPR